jgi:putative ABC transport system permease protein
VWLVACANAAGLVAIRNAARAREFGTRLSLGATRARLTAQVLTESLALSAVAGSLGVIAAGVTLPLLVALLPSDLPRVADIALDRRVLGYTGLCTVVTAVLAALLPAWHTSRLPLFSTAGVATPVIAAKSGVRAALVIGQLALAQVLLLGAALLMTTLAHLLHTDTGFQPDRVAAALYYLPDATYVTRDRIVGFHRAFIDRVSHLPGVASAGLLTPPPFGMGGGQTDVVIEGRDGTIRIDGFRASPGALGALGAPLRSGRFFDERDGADAPVVAVIDEQFARQYLGPGDPLRRRLRLARSNVWMPIVGVAGHIVTRSLEVPDRPQIYLPLFGTSLHFTSVLVRTHAGPPLAPMGDVRAVARELDPALPLFNAATMTTVISGTTGRQRLGAYLLTAFAAAALALAAIGVAGIVGYSVTLRTRELGIRLALGARPRALVAGLVVHGGALTLGGLMLGLLGGLAAAHVFSSLVAGTQVLNPVLLGTTALALLGVGAVASYLPARRVSSIDLVTILKRE